MDSYSILLTLLAGYISFLFVIGYLFNRRQTSLREFLLGGSLLADGWSSSGR